MLQEYFEKVDAAFGCIKADPKWKTFTYNGIKMMGVNKVVQQYEPKFDKVGQAAKTAAKEGKTPEQVIAEWDMKGKISSALGSVIHEYIEGAMANKFVPYPDVDIKAQFGGEDPIQESYNRIALQVNNFRESIRGKLIPVGSEVVIGSPKYMICGIVDQIFWNKKAQEFQIWDWKTNGKFNLDSNFKLEGLLSRLGNCEYHKYSMQLALYRRIFTEETGIPIGKCYLCWFSSETPVQQMFPIYDCEAEANAIMAERAKQLGLVDQGSVF